MAGATNAGCGVAGECARSLRVLNIEYFHLVIKSELDAKCSLLNLKAPRVGNVTFFGEYFF
jgi:hypothetical protein